ncbi:MAG: hypothetical protein AB7K52_07785 [Phycisphaerales bacterium]
MAKGQHLSAYQQGIVKRYYEHADTLAVSALGEIVSELAVAESPKSAEKLWVRARTALARAGVDGQRIDDLAARRDVKGLAALVGELWGGGGGGRARPKA